MQINVFTVTCIRALNPFNIIKLILGEGWRLGLAWGVVINRHTATVILLLGKLLSAIYALRETIATRRETKTNKSEQEAT